MEKTSQKTDQQQLLAVKDSKPNLISALQTGRKQEIIGCLKQFKYENGAVNYPAIFSIHSENRLPELAKSDYNTALTIVTAGLALAFENMNLARGMNETQMIDLADTVLDSSSEDNLALEDLMLFLQKLTRGEYGKLYESMDVPKFMELFEIYREDRFRAIQAVREEESVQFKAIPINDRLSDMFKPFEQEQYKQAINSYLRIPKEESK